MEQLINYGIKFTFCLLVLYLFYYALLRSQTHFKFNRLFLLLAPPVAFTLPLIEWSTALVPDISIAGTLQVFRLSEIVVTAYTPSAQVNFSYHSLAFVAGLIYFSIAIFFLLKLAFQIIKLKKLKAGANLVESEFDSIHIYRHRGNLPTFAYLNTIFLGNEDHLSPQEQKQVLAHEIAHVQLHHTLDILYYEVLTAVLWFNPVIWLLKREIRTVHEYQADARVIEQYKPQEYGSLLSKKVLFEMGVPVGSHFHKPQIIKRLFMLRQHGKQASWVRPLLTLPLLLILLLIFTTQQVTADIAYQATAPTKTKASLPTQEEEMPGIRKESTDNMPIVKDNDAAEAQMPTYKKEKAYAYVEQMPEFKGGEQEMFRFLGENIRYPKTAQEAGTEGLVVLSFVIEKDGTVNDVQVLKKLGMGTDEEAMRVVELMNGKWQPGKQDGQPVPVRYTLPIRFAIR